MTKWNELKVKIQMLSKGEQLILLFICAFVIALFPGGYIAALMVGSGSPDSSENWSLP